MQLSDWIAIAGISGTLLGTVVGALLSWFVQRTNWKREDHHRFGEEKRTKYAAFVGVVNRFQQSAPDERDGLYEEFTRIWAVSPVFQCAGPGRGFAGSIRGYGFSFQKT